MTTGEKLGDILSKEVPMTTREKLGEIWLRVWPIVLILAVTAVAWLVLSHLALHAREKDAAQILKGPLTADYATAKTWATDILGLAATLAGFLGVAAAAKKTLNLTATERAEVAEGGVLGILAGATLLGVGGWLAPLGLVAVGSGAATGRVIRALRAPA